MQAATVDITTEEIERLINVTGGDRFLLVITATDGAPQDTLHQEKGSTKPLLCEITIYRIKYPTMNLNG